MLKSCNDNIQITIHLIIKNCNMIGIYFIIFFFLFLYLTMYFEIIDHLFKAFIISKVLYYQTILPLNPILNV